MPYTLAVFVFQRSVTVRVFLFSVFSTTEVSYRVVTGRTPSSPFLLTLPIFVLILILTGDLCPTTAVGKIFTCVFGFSGIALLGAIVANLGSKLVSLELETMNKVQSESRKNLLMIYDKMPKIIKNVKRNKMEQRTNTDQQPTDIAQQVKDETQKEISSSKDDSVVIEDLPSLILNQPKPIGVTIWKTTQWVLKSLMVVIVGGLIIGRLEGWSVCDSIYYSLVTASTIGLGDFSPQTKGGRIMAIIMIPTLVAAAGEVLAGIGLTLVERRQRKIYQNQLRKGLTEKYIKAMDKDGDGRV
jgi:hypothetical protein